jgi:hypothetical protein
MDWGIVAGTIGGFSNAVAPKLIALYQDRQDKRHELAIMDRQAIQKNLEREAIIDMPPEMLKSMTFQPSAQDGLLTKTVRPVVTYGVFGVWALYKVYMPSWGVDDNAILSYLMSFWFTNRQLGK